MSEIVRLDKKGLPRDFDFLFMLNQVMVQPKQKFHCDHWSVYKFDRMYVVMKDTKGFDV